MPTNQSLTRTITHAVISLILTWAVLALCLVPSLVEAHGGDPTAFHGCRKIQNGQLRLVEPTGTCLPSETAVDWSITGPQGPQGPPGPAGPIGPTGPPGPAGGGSGTEVFYPYPPPETAVGPDGFAQLARIHLLSGAYVVSAKAELHKDDAYAQVDWGFTVICQLRLRQADGTLLGNLDQSSFAFTSHQTPSGLLVPAATFASLSLSAVIGVVDEYVSLECYGSHSFARWIQLNAIKVGAANIQLP